ncbi:hypothetical protein [Cognatilysobacter lacus]|uniref:Uncharacterized protein n=1 Tax=Cognatilysobacter lacus TaxID=1643323 RepID=A0A5D8Z7Q4_9GAMM|nr:hypothetical protein [Lysobacter lacus]TZF90720.1 hypothetical protein FW784_04255 [Lysobacter lacus]
MSPSTWQVQTMASGNLSLEIDPDMSWERFPVAAKAFLSQVRGIPLLKISTPVERLWIVLVGFRLFWLAVDEMGMSLDSITKHGNKVILTVAGRQQPGGA